MIMTAARPTHSTVGMRQTSLGSTTDRLGDARAVIIHRDSVTGIDRVFALHGVLGVMSGVYDPNSTLPGKVRWDSTPEKLDLSQVGNGEATTLEFRPLSLVIAIGKLHISSGSWILQRCDGPEPVWKGVVDIVKLRTKDGPLNPEVGGIRGMTAVSCPEKPELDSILFCWNPNPYSSHRGSFVLILELTDF